MASYEEMKDKDNNDNKDMSEVRGSLNIVIHEFRQGRRPLSMSESWAETPSNRERAQHLLDTVQLPPLLSEEETEVLLPCASQHLLLISFLFHITLISLFETLFFFLYVSALENTGILKTVGGFTNTLLSDCGQLGPEGRSLLEWAIAPYINATEEKGVVAFQRRAAFNYNLQLLSWYYVIGIAAVFFAAAGFGCYRRLQIPWRRLLLENCGLVCMLGLFEGLFFTTIVYPYAPVTSQEIAANIVSDLQSTCLYKTLL